MVVVVVVRRGRVVVLVVSIIVHLGKVGFFKCLITECSKCGTKKALFSRVFCLSQNYLQKMKHRPSFFRSYHLKLTLLIIINQPVIGATYCYSIKLKL